MNDGSKPIHVFAERALRDPNARGVQPPFAIVGMAARFPRADTIAAFWQHIVDKVDCVRPVPEARRADFDAYLDASSQYIDQGYLDTVDRFDARFFDFAEKEAELTDPRQRLFLQTAFRAIEDAGLTRTHIAGSRLAVFLACNGERDYLRLIERFQPRSAAVAIPLNSVALIASRVSHAFDLKGPAVVVDTECSSSLVALHYACRSIAAGDCDAAIVGAVDLNFFPIADAPKLGIESPDGRTRAFDDRATGTGNGEGVAAIFVKPLARALADRDRIHAVILGSAINNDGYGKVMTSPNSQAQTQVILDAWRASGVDAEAIAYIEAHGTGTKIGDPIEIAGLTGAFNAQTTRRGFCCISSVKTNIGHLNHAAGLAGLVKATMALRARVLPPSLHFETPNRQIDFAASAVYVGTTAAPWEQGTAPRRCGVSSFGLNGTNAHVVLEEAPPRGPAPPRADAAEPWVFVLSAPSDDALRQRVQACITMWQDAGADVDADGVDLASLCYTAGVRSDHYARRIAVTARTRADLIAQLRGWLTDGRDPATPLPASATAYLAGEDVDWSDRFAELDVRVVPFPPVPLEERRFWIAMPPPAQRPTGGDAPVDMSADAARASASEASQASDVQTGSVPTGPILTGRQDGGYSETEIAVARLWASSIATAEVDVMADFYELGADSMSFLQIVVKIEKHFAIAFQDDFLDFDAFANFQDLIKYIDERTAAAALEPGAASSNA